MRKWTKATGLIFLAAASVYSGQVVGAAPGKSARPNPKAPEPKNTDVKLLEDQFDPFAGTGPTTQPAERASSATSAAAAGGVTGSSVSNTSGSASSSGNVPAMQTNADGTFSLNITNGADLVETLRVIGFQAQKSVLPSKEVHANLPALDLYNVTVPEALEAILKVNGFVYKEEGNFIYVYSAKEAAEMEKANRVQNTEVFRVFYTPAANAANMLKPVLSPEAQVALTSAASSGLDSGTKGTGGNDHAIEDMLVVTDYPENLDRVRKILKEIDRRPQQILVEATIMRAALSDDNRLGVDFNVVGGVDFSSVTSSNGQITNGNIASGSTNFGDQRHSVGTGNSFSSPITGGLKVGFISNNVSAFVSALEGITDTTVLANPKVLALNKQKGEVIVGNKTGYLTTTLTDTSATQTVEFLDTGTRLIFRPFIGDDGYIRMEIHPEDSSGGLGPSNLPFKVTTEVTSNIMVKDGHTIVIGGLFRESSDSARSQIPVLGNLPLAGVLFRNQADRTTREEIIILLTPHVIKDDSAYSEASEELLKAGEQMRMGVRKGMMFWGRERLAETAYESALAALNKDEPDRGRALWHLDCAINLNPKFLEAIQLKSELTGKTLTSVDNSAIRGFVRRQIMEDRGRTPATMPTSDSDVLGDDPSTQPTTRPSYAMGEPTTSPSTQPSMADCVSEFSLDGPSTQPSMPGMAGMDLGMDMEAVMKQHRKEIMSDETDPSTSSSGMGAMLGSMMQKFTLGREPATQPSQNQQVPMTTVTELPTEEMSGAGQSPAPGNK
jgi:type IV pilus assembly protein PilQ